jgi:molybdopterin-dependent oxidoreductase-like protein protein
MDRWKRLVNVTLLALLVIATGSGWLAFAIGSTGPAKIIVSVHGVSGLALLLLVPAKSRIVQWGLRSAGRSRIVIGFALGALVLLTVASGLLHAVGGWRTYFGLLPMQIHVAAASAAIPLMVTHVVIHHRLRRRRPLVRRTDLNRRAALAAAGTVVGSAALWLVVPGPPRRETGSHEIGSHAIGSHAVGSQVGADSIDAVPVTQWLFDPIPRISSAQWRLRLGWPQVAGLGAAGLGAAGLVGAGLVGAGRELDLTAFAAMPQRTVRAVLDCTGGWWTEQEWRGVPLSALGLPPGASIEVVSATGYRRRFPVGAADSLLLATHAAGRPLSAGHGGPARLVAPGRRGFCWVKWVTSINVLDEPWWWQPPFPLQ